LETRKKIVGQSVLAVRGTDVYISVMILRAPSCRPGYHDLSPLLLPLKL